MIKKLHLIITTLSFLLIASAAQANTFKYEIQNIQSFNGAINYPGLNLNAISGTLTIEQSSQFDEPVVKSLDVNFLEAKPLAVRSFSSVGGFGPLRASVNNAWVFRKLNVEINTFDFLNPNFQFLSVNVYVSENDNFINNIGQQEQLLLTLDGILVDVTPSKVSDTESLLVNGERLRLSLRNALTSVPELGLTDQVVINSVWFGNGEENIYLPAGTPSNLARFVKPYRINLTTIAGPQGDDNFISVSLRDREGVEFESPQFLLQDLLDQAYPGSVGP